MIAIFTDGLGYTSSFVFLPLIQYFSRQFLDHSMLHDLIYKLCDVFTILLYSLLLEWVGKKHHNLQGDGTMEENIFLLVLCFFIKQTVIYYGNSQIKSSHALSSNIMASAVAIFGIALILYSFSYADKKLGLLIEKQNNSLLKHQLAAWQQEEKQLSGFRHDFKNHMLCLKNLLVMKKNEEAINYLDCITDTVHSFYPDVSSGNVYADAIIKEKVALAKAWNIKLEADFIFPSSEFIPYIDLCIILSNALENALEACQKRSGKATPPTVLASSCIKRSCLFITIENPSPYGKIITGGFPRSTKADPHLHGLGLFNIRNAVSRCHGIMDMTVSSDIVQVTVMLPLYPPSS